MPCYSARSLRALQQDAQCAVSSVGASDAAPDPCAHLASLPAVPTPAALAGSATANLEQLAREYNETIAFIGKQLKKDPRLKPGDVQLNFEHPRIR
jgi:hypothetical protein